MPFQKAQAQTTVEAMRSLVELYSFVDLSANSGPPYNLKVDLRALLDDVQTKVITDQYSNDYAFQTDLMNMLNPLFDAHTLYRAPAGYRCFFTRPFTIEASTSNGEMQYTVREGLLGAKTSSIWSRVFDVDITPYLNQVVTNINGMTPTDHLMLVAQKFVANYKDHGVRFNAALRRRWSQVLLNTFPLTDPNLDFVTSMQFANGMTVNMPNVAFCNGGGISGTKDLLLRNELNLSASDAMAELNKTFLEQGIDVHREEEEMFQKEAVRALSAPIVYTHKLQAIRPEEVDRKQMVKVRDYRPLHRILGREFHDTSGHFVPTQYLPADFNASRLTLVASTAAKDAYFMKYDKIGEAPTWILKLTTFRPANTNDTIAIIQKVIEDGQRHNGVNLIVDVAYNGGGWICLADLLLALLVEEWGNLDPHNHHYYLGKNTPPHLTVPYGIYDYRQSQSALAMRSVDVLNDKYTSYGHYLNYGDESRANASFYNPVARTRGGFTSNYTQQAYFPAACVGYPRGSFKSIPYYFKNILVVTDGTCGSACALLTSQLQSQGLATIVSYGGPIKREIPLSTASFAGGNVLEYDVVSKLARLKGGDAPNLPPMMNSSATSRFNFNEYYELDDREVPREFLKRPAHVHLDFWATLYQDDPTTPLGLSNNAALYSIVTTIGDGK